MPREIVTLHVGQGGNQVGAEFWKRICEEHGIDADGGVAPAEADSERRDVFFSEAGDGRWGARALMIDLEHKAIQGARKGVLQNVLEEEQVVVAREGAGAGNNWASGYTQGESLGEQMQDQIDRLLERTDSAEGFLLTHSIAGGTGSGLGSWLMESLRDRHPKKLLSAVSVFPSSEADVVVQPYNALLSLKRLTLLADSCLVLDNGALHQALSRGSKSQLSMNELNVICAQILSGATAPIRFGSHTWSSLVAPLCPSPRLHFLSPGVAPLALSQPPQTGFHVAKALPPRPTPETLIQRLLLPKNLLLSGPPGRGMYLGMTIILRGATYPEQAQMERAIWRLSQPLPLVPWAPVAPRALFLPSSPTVGNTASGSVTSLPPLNGTLLTNHTGVQVLLSQLLRQYDRMRKVGAYIENYRNHGGLFKDNLDEFDDAREVVRALFDEYQASSQPRPPSS